MKINLEVADVTRPLVVVGELQMRGMTVVMGPHGSFVTRGQVMKPPGNNLDLEHPNGAYRVRLTRRKNGTSTVALVDLGDDVQLIPVKFSALSHYESWNCCELHDCGACGGVGFLMATALLLPLAQGARGAARLVTRPAR